MEGNNADNAKWESANIKTQSCSLADGPQTHRHTHKPESNTCCKIVLHHSVSLTLHRTHDSGRLGALSVCHVAQEPRVWSAPPAGEQRSDLQLMHCWISATGCAVELLQTNSPITPLPSEVLKLLTCHIQGALGKSGNTHTTALLHLSDVYFLKSKNGKSLWNLGY